MTNGWGDLALSEVFNRTDPAAALRTVAGAELQVPAGEWRRV